MNLKATQSRPDRRCDNCGAETCDVRIDGEWVACDWPPVAPVVEFDNFIVATDGDYAEMRDGEVKRADLTFNGFRVPGVTASIIVTRHRCDATTRLVRQFTERGAAEYRRFRERDS